MSWMSESFKKDKRYLGLQLKRGQIKQKDIEKVLSDLPELSEKAMILGNSENTEDDKDPIEEKQDASL